MHLWKDVRCQEGTIVRMTNKPGSAGLASQDVYGRDGFSGRDDGRDRDASEESGRGNASGMKLRTYRAWTMAEALAAVKSDLGADAVILHTRSLERRGFFGLGRRTVVELTAARASEMPAAPAAAKRPQARETGRNQEANAVPRATADDSLRASAARRAYGSPNPTPAAAEREAVGGGTADRDADFMTPAELEIEREKTRRLAQAMALQLERTAGMREAAIANERATQSASQSNGHSMAPAARSRGGEQSTGTARPSANGAGLPQSSANASAAASSAGSSAASSGGLVPTHPLPKSEPVAQRFVLVPASASSQGGAQGRSVVAQLASPVAPSAHPVSVSASVAPNPTQPEPPQPSKPAHAVQSKPAGDALRPNAPVFDPLQFAQALANPEPVTPRAAEPDPGCAVGESFASFLSIGDAAVPVPTTSPAPVPRNHALESPDATNELSAISDFVGRVIDGRMIDGRMRVADPAPDAESTPPVRRAAVDAAPPVARAADSESAASSSRPTEAGAGELPKCLETHYAHLIEQEVSAVLAARILADVAAELRGAIDAGATPSERVVRNAIERRIASLLPADAADGLGSASARLLPGRHGARRVAFIGPTGVGKTTTLAKIAAQLKLKRGLSVGIVAADTYRIAAVDQLRTYAEILELPVEVASSPSEAHRACERLVEEHGVDVILIDTAGRSQNDRMKLSELRAFLQSASPDETHLVLSATASARTLEREASSFGALGVDRIVLTKLDEAATFGTLLSLVERLGKRVSFLTHGQEVPEHIELGRAQRLAELVMGSEVR